MTPEHDPPTALPAEPEAEESTVTLSPLEIARLDEEGARLSKAFMERTASMEHAPGCGCRLCLTPKG